MKTLAIPSISKNLIGALALLLSVQLSTTQPTQAQTFARENQLRTDPTVLPALIYPTNKPQTVRVNAHNLPRGPLTIVVRDNKGIARHTEVTFATRYSGNFDLSPLGTGTYTFELSNEAGQRFSRTFRIETSVPRVIAVENPLDKPFELTDTVGLLNH